MCQNVSETTGWWFQPIWKILVKLDNFPKTGMNMKNIWNHHPESTSYLDCSQSSRSTLSSPPNLFHFCSKKSAKKKTCGSDSQWWIVKRRDPGTWNAKEIHYFRENFSWDDFEGIFPTVVRGEIESRPDVCMKNQPARDFCSFNWASSLISSSAMCCANGIRAEDNSSRMGETSARFPASKAIFPFETFRAKKQQQLRNKRLKIFHGRTNLPGRNLAKPWNGEDFLTGSFFGTSFAFQTSSNMQVHHATSPIVIDLLHNKSCIAAMKI